MSAYVTAVCPRCRAAFDELLARVPLPDSYDAERCSCNAILSFRYPDPTQPGRWIRQRIER